MDINTRPITTADESRVAINGTISALSMFNVFDPDPGASVVLYELQDDIGGGFFVNGDFGLASNEWLSFTPAEIGAIEYQGHSIVSSENFRVRVTDSAGNVSLPSEAIVNTVVADSFNPSQVIAFESQAPLNGSVPALSMFAVLDFDDPHFVETYEFQDFGVEGGSFVLNGITFAPNAWFSVPAADIASLRYFGDDIISEELFGVRVIDSGGNLSNEDTNVVRTLETDIFTTPIVTALPSSGAVNSRLSLLDMVRVNDPDIGAEIATYQIRDNSPAGGSFLLNNEVLAANQWHDVAGFQVPGLEYRTSDEFFTETFSVRVIDSAGNISNTSTSTVTSGNSPSVVTATDGRLLPLQFTSIKNYFSVSDFDGDTPQTVGFLDRSIGANGGNFQVRGEDLPQAQWAFYRWSELDDVLYQAADDAGSEIISVMVYDGHSFSEQVDFTLTTGARPVIETTSLSTFENEVRWAGAFFSFTDADGDLPVTYSVIDRRNNADGGYFQLNGVRQESGKWFAVSALEFNSLEYVGAASGPDSENLAFHVYDSGGQYSVVTDIIVNTETLPEVTATNVSIKRDQYINMATGGISNVSGAQAEGTPFLNYLDADGDAVEQLMFIDYQLNINGGHFVLDGVRLPSATHFVVDTADLAKLEYRAGLFGPQTESLSAFAFSNGRWGAQEDFEIFTLQNGFRPEVDMFDASARLGVTSELNGLFSWVDQDGDLPVSFSIYDTGSTANSGYFTDNGVVLAAQQWNSFDWSKVADIKYHFAGVGSSEVVRMVINDGRSVSNINSAIMTAVDAPEIAANNNAVSIDSIERISASTLISQTDLGPGFTQYEIYDENTALRSGRFELNGVDLQQGVMHTLSAAEFANVDFKGAEADFGRQLDPILVRATNGITGWSEWERVNVNTDPVGGDSLVSGFQWNDNRVNTAVTTVVTYTFIDGDQANSAGHHPPVPTYYICAGEGTPVDAECNEPDGDEAHGLNVAQRESVRETLEGFSRFANIEFLEVPFIADASNAALTFGATNLPPGVGAWAYLPIGDVVDGQGTKSGDVWFDTDSFDPDINFDAGAGSDFRFTAAHEIGHALGLAHSFDTPALPNASGFDYNTVMSYTHDSVHNPLRDLNGGAGYPEQPSSAMLYDVVELQRLYGVNPTHNDNNNHYGNFISGSEPHFFDNDTSHQTTLYDAGGFDTYNFTNHVADETIDLRQGTWSSINGVQLSLRTAYLTVIENARGGSGNDTIRGNEIENLIFGNAGNDLLRGGGANDVLRGGAGNDTYVWQTGDGRDIIQEESAGGTDVLMVLDPSGSIDSLNDDFIFRRLGNDLRIDLTYNQGDGQGTITIDNFADANSRVEVLQIHDSLGNQIGSDIDLISIFDQATVVHTRFQVTGPENAYTDYSAFAASPV